MAKQPRLTAAEAERLLSRAGYSLVRSKGSHRIYMRGQIRVVVPFHRGKTLHPKIVRDVMEAIGKEGV